MWITDPKPEAQAALAAAPAGPSLDKCAGSGRGHSFLGDRVDQLIEGHRRRREAEAASGAKPPDRSWRRRRELREFLEARMARWMVEGAQVLWVTLTSSPQSPPNILDQHKKLKKRILREFGVDYRYVAIQTSEGHGVLHMFWAWVDPEGARRSFYIDQAWLSAAWQDLNLAHRVWIERVRDGADDAAKVARYAVNQYAAGQSAIVRVAATPERRNGMAFHELRRQVSKRVLDRYHLVSALGSVKVRVRVEWDGGAAHIDVDPDNPAVAWWREARDCVRRVTRELWCHGCGWFAVEHLAICEGKLHVVASHWEALEDNGRGNHGQA